jgi:hypothetical protein
MCFFVACSMAMRAAWCRSHPSQAKAQTRSATTTTTVATRSPTSTRPTSRAVGGVSAASHRVTSARFVKVSVPTRTSYSLLCIHSPCGEFRTHAVQNRFARRKWSSAEGPLLGPARKLQATTTVPRPTSLAAQRPHEVVFSGLKAKQGEDGGRTRPGRRSEWQRADLRAGSAASPEIPADARVLHRGARVLCCGPAIATWFACTSLRCHSLPHGDTCHPGQTHSHSRYLSIWMACFACRASIVKFLHFDPFLKHFL